jgi:hypothetical protein
MHLKANMLCRQTREELKAIETSSEDGGKDEGTLAKRKFLGAQLEEDAPSPAQKMQRMLHTYQAILDDDTAARQKLFQRGNEDVEKRDNGGTVEHYPEPEVWFDPFAASSSDDGNDDGQAGNNTESGEEDEEQQDANEFQPSTESNTQLKKYVRHAYLNFARLGKKEKTAIRLMHKLVKKKATLDTYEAVMEWYLRESGKLKPQETLGKSKFFISREKLMKKLIERYNMADKFAAKKQVVLPHTRTKIDVMWHHARDCVQSILTDPRWHDEDWLYFDDDPFAPPPNDLTYVGDFNTGEAYLETYRQLITKPRQILVGIPLYIDGAVTGQFDKLQVTALKMSLCILNRKARDKEFAWRTLGFVTNYTKEDSRGKKIFVESGHVAAHELYVDMSDEEEGEHAGHEDEVDKAADYHAILAVLLESLFELIAEGMLVDIFYKGQLHKDCELVFFVPFVKCDGDEGDKLCCSYRSRGLRVKQLCRYCQCPNDDTDNPDANWPYKTEPMLKKLYEARNEDRLRELSQICIKNAFHGLRFGLQNDRGIHGACPWELLHAILLGIFKYARDCFFAQMGATSATAEEINSLAKMIGHLFARQSDRNVPRTKFAKGILKGKLMAKEYTGVLLVMAAILRCKAGQDMLQGARKKNFRDSWQRRDWLLLVETLLQWEAYLNLDQMEKKHVVRLKRKHRFIMFLLKKVGNRTKGMGFKVMKFHAIIHLAYDILMFGVPMVVDTGSNESHHKTTKVAAKLTQKDIKTFEKQTSNRLDEFHVLDLAMEEVDGRPLWEYFSGWDRDEPEPPVEKTKTGGMQIEVYMDLDNMELSFEVKTRMKNSKDVQIDTNLLEYLWELQQYFLDHVGPLRVCSEHTRGGKIFRAHPNYRGKGPWKDWAMIKWEEGDYPAQFWCFVDLSEMPGDTTVELEDGTVVGRGVYAVVESCDYIDEEEPQSDIFKPLMLETKELSDDGIVTKRKFYFVDVETIKEPIVVIPDIGAKPACQYLLMAPRTQWSKDFIAWIEMPHQHDQMEMIPPPEDDDDDDEEEDVADG